MPFLVIIWHLCILLSKISLYIFFFHFLAGFLSFVLVLGFESSLFIIDTSPLTDICDLQIYIYKYSASLWFIFILF